MIRDDIKTAMVASAGSNDTLQSVNTTSKVGVFNLLIDLVSFGCSLVFQAFALLKIQLEARYNSNNVCTDDWWFDKISQFQYSASEVQKLIIYRYVAKYLDVKPELRILSSISVTTESPGIVQIKASKGIPAQKLADAELNQLKGYVKAFVPTGMKASVRSYNPDKLYIVGELYYDGNYASVILANIKTAITNYILSRKDGIYSNSDIELVIRQVEGVLDVKLTQIAGRSESQNFASRVRSFDLPLSLNNRQYVSLSGSLVFEDTAGETIEDRLTLIAA